MAMQPLPLLLAFAVPLLATADPRRIEEKTPWPCHEKYDAATVEQWVDKHLASASQGHARPHMLLMLGGSGAGKGSFLKRWAAVEKESIADFVAHGLDEYLEYIPEYQKTVKDTAAVYKDAADACYPGAAIPAAKLGTDKITDRKMNVIYEETGKNLDRIKKRVLPPSVKAGYRVTVVLVDANPEVAITRSAGRFQQTGRYAPDDYIRGTFANTQDSYNALKAMEEVSEAVFCDNWDVEMVCHADGRRTDDGAALVPRALLAQPPSDEL